MVIGVAITFHKLGKGIETNDINVFVLIKNSPLPHNRPSSWSQNFFFCGLFYDAISSYTI
jgi:hypothetical protein